MSSLKHILFFIGPLTEEVNSEKNPQQAIEFFEKNIFNKKIKTLNEGQIIYCQDRFTLLAYCVPSTPLFAFRTCP